MTRGRVLDWAPAVVVLAVLVLAPLLFSEYYLSAVLTKAMWLGIAAVTVVLIAGGAI